MKAVYTEKVSKAVYTEKDSRINTLMKKEIVGEKIIKRYSRLFFTNIIGIKSLKNMTLLFL